MPEKENTWAIVTYKIPIPFEIGRARLAASFTVFLASENGEKFDDGAITILEVSGDGEEWHQIGRDDKDSPHHSWISKDISNHVAGCQHVFVRSRLLCSKSWPGVGPIFAQFLRTGTQSPSPALVLKVDQCGE